MSVARGEGLIVKDPSYTLTLRFKFCYESPMLQFDIVHL